MLDVWYTFAASMGDHQAWISFNQGYAEVAEGDSRNHALRVQLPFKFPSEHGLSTNKEFPQLLAVDETLESEVTGAGGAYVGRVTVAGHRYFYYYVDFSEQKAADIVERVAAETAYNLKLQFNADEDKHHYWNDLYPTADDWQVVWDLKTMEQLRNSGDVDSVQREIRHWAYLPDESSCSQFSDWVSSEDYVLLVDCQFDEEAGFQVHYRHVGTVQLADITGHTIPANRMARKLGGRYDGWETTVESR
ncbi:DUF695 domain-containing protein [Marinobacter xestospongiae]|uniref:DUF695 domain-containing protein n=1 Tax=Marinobacter xestospongiae TaxID=994319 RepID=A0ABU3W287_9GAMM|nr:DUF695 domain-containing protein [Marinobacter xestospongiae]MDV2080637.1 DUF695 domain-containing protein [Marinobacter xestospongiae]